MKKEVVKKTEIEIRDFLGTNAPFRQGGSLRVIFPKRAAKHPMFSHEIHGNIEELTLAFVDTDKGILIRPLKDMLKEGYMY